MGGTVSEVTGKILKSFLGSKLFMGNPKMYIPVRICLLFSVSKSQRLKSDRDKM
jgi:hypothetical protein